MHVLGCMNLAAHKQFFTQTILKHRRFVRKNEFITLYIL